jgi:hemoglobin
MALSKQDIATKEDVTTLIDLFYTKVRADELLAPVFSHVDWEHHTPVIINFWCMVLLGDLSYRGNPFQKHINLPIQQHHFEKWLHHFRQTVDENFSGDKAEEAKTRASNIASMFQFRLGLIK